MLLDSCLLGYIVDCLAILLPSISAFQPAWQAQDFAVA